MHQMPKSNDPVVSFGKYATFAKVHEIQIRALDLVGAAEVNWLLYPRGDEDL